MIRRHNLSLTLVALVAAAPVLAATPRVVKPKVPSAVSGVRPTLIEYGEVMFMTAPDGTHHWQVRIDNKDRVPATNVVVPAWVHGFLAGSEKPSHAAPVPSIPPGGMAYARGPLPLFPGAHLLRLRSQVNGLDVEMPRPYRQDAPKGAASALTIEDFTVIETGTPGTVRFTARTGKNIYEPIPVGKAGAGVYVRLRTRKSGMEGFWMPAVCVGQHTSTAVIPSGGRWTFSGSITVPSVAPSQLFDRVALRCGSQIISRPVASIHWQGCHDFGTVYDLAFEAGCRQ